MQEQHPYKMTPEQGWSNMTYILDKAMPVERRSRRPIVFWWAAAAVSTAAIILLFTLMNQQSSQQPSLAKESTQLNTGDQPVLENQNSSTISETEVQTTDHENVSNIEAEKEAGNKASTGSNIDGTKEIAKVDPKTSSPKKSFINPDQKTEIVGSEIPRTKLQNEVFENNSLTNADAQEINATRESVLILDQLQSNAVAFITTDASTDLIGTDIQPNLIASQSGKRLLTPHISASGIHGFSSGLGVQGGVGVDVNVSPKLSFTADLGYATYHPYASALGFSIDNNFAENYGVLRNDLAYQGIGDYLPAELVSKSTDNVEPFLKAIYQWQFSAGAKYDLSKKLFVQAGATLGFGTTTRSSYPIVESTYPTSGAFLNISNSFDSYDVIRSTMTSFYGGLGYRLSKRTELFAQVNYGFDHYLLKEPGFNSVDATASNDYIRGVAVGMRYNFSGP